MKKIITFQLEVEDDKDEIKDTVDVCMFFGWLAGIAKHHNAKLTQFGPVKISNELTTNTSTTQAN